MHLPIKPLPPLCPLAALSRSRRSDITYRVPAGWGGASFFFFFLVFFMIIILQLWQAFGAVKGPFIQFLFFFFPS